MPFQLTRLRKAEALPATFTSKFKFSLNTDEHGQVAQLAKRAGNNQCRIYVLTNNGEYYGFVALSLAVFAQVPSVVVDYLFTSVQFRGVEFEDLERVKVADYLLAFALKSAITVSEIVPVRFLALIPADETLDAYYRRRGFSKLDSTDWMFTKVPPPLG